MPVEEPPTVKELITRVKSLTRDDGTFQQAWKDSFPDRTVCCEQGGFIYIDFPIRRPITRAYIGKAKKEGPRMKQVGQDKNPATIDLNAPDINMNNVILVANFHTHPLSERSNGNPQPSMADMQNAYARGLPGIVVSRDGLYSYGPDTRNGTTNPEKYAPSVPLSGVPTFTLVQRSPPPKTVPNQWPEGTATKPKLDHDFEQEQEAFETPDGSMGAKAQDEDEAGAEEFHGDVLYVDWSDEGVEYGERLEDNCAC